MPTCHVSVLVGMLLDLVLTLVGTITVHMLVQGNIAEWKVEEGQEVSAGDVLAEVETDKATMDWESQVLLCC